MDHPGVGRQHAGVFRCVLRSHGDRKRYDKRGRVFSSRELDDLLVDIMSKYNSYMIERSSKQFSDLKLLMALIIRKSEEEEK